MEFQRFSLSESGMSAQSYVYEGHKTETGVHLEHFIRSEYWDNTVSGNVEQRTVIRAIDGDDALYQKVCTLFGACRIDQWADFRGDNAPDVLDGSSMGFTAVLADGTEITASGRNNFPKNYRTFTDELNKLITAEEIRSTAFTDGTYEITLPESWIGVVTARFTEFGVTFSVNKADGGEVIFFILDNNGYGYSADDYSGAMAVGRLVSGDDVRFITARPHSPISAFADSVSENALALWEHFEADEAAIIESFRGANGYKFYPEDGSTLYEAGAWELSEQARSLWLRLNFAGEYSEGIRPVQIQGRKYLPMFPARDSVYTIAQVREKFLEVFSEEFTDKTLNTAIANKDLLEYNGNVYAACKKNKGETSYNSWADHVQDDGDGKFTVVMGVSMPPDGSTVYVELPAEKNAAGYFVFTDYPYWDQSE